MFFILVRVDIVLCLSKRLIVKKLNDFITDGRSDMKVLIKNEGLQCGTNLMQRPFNFSFLGRERKSNQLNRDWKGEDNLWPQINNRSEVDEFAQQPVTTKVLRQVWV